MAKTREIITLQFGTFANFVSSHFWNAQEAQFEYKSEGDEVPEINHNNLFRTGLNSRNEETYTPRMILFELKERFGNFKKIGDLYDTQASPKPGSIWEGKIHYVQQEKYTKNEYQKHLERAESDLSLPESIPMKFSEILEERVQYWSDYNRIYYHPKSIVEFPHIIHREFQEPLSYFQHGEDLLNGVVDLREEILEERIRFFLEECDSFQGFNILADASTGFSGVAKCVIQDILDNLPKSGIHVYGVAEGEEPGSENEHELAHINQGMLFSNLFETSVTYIPLYSPSNHISKQYCMKNVHGYKSENRYLSSAYLATVLDTLTLPCRTNRNPFDLRDISTLLGTSRGYNISTALCSLPGPIADPSIFTPSHQIKWLNDLSNQVPHDTQGVEIGSLLTMRGFPSYNSKKDTAQLLSSFLSSYKIPYAYHKSSLHDSFFKTYDSYPSFFESENVSCMTRLCTRASTKKYIEKFIPILEKKRVNADAWVDCADLVENLRSMVQLYEELV